MTNLNQFIEHLQKHPETLGDTHTKQAQRNLHGAHAGDNHWPAYKKRQHQTALEAYGTTCERCNETRPTHLGVYPVCGLVHPKGLGHTLENELNKLGYPSGYQTLCDQCVDFYDHPTIAWRKVHTGELTTKFGKPTDTDLDQLGIPENQHPKQQTCQHTGNSLSYAYAHGCRCDQCTEYNRVRVAEIRANQKARKLAQIQCPVHHQSASYAYKNGCRCQTCVRTNRQRVADHHQHKRPLNHSRVPVEDAQRLIEATRGLGYTLLQISLGAKISLQTLNRIRRSTGQGKQVDVVNYYKLARCFELYNQICEDAKNSHPDRTLW